MKGEGRTISFFVILCFTHQANPPSQPAAKKQDRRFSISQTNVRGPATKRGSKGKSSTSVKKTEEMSWFDLDPVFGFGLEDQGWGIVDQQSMYHTCTIPGSLHTWIQYITIPCYQGCSVYCTTLLPIVCSILNFIPKVLLFNYTNLILLL